MLMVELVYHTDAIRSVAAAFCRARTSVLDEAHTYEELPLKLTWA
jgi:hypothetical protein